MPFLAAISDSFSGAASLSRTLYTQGASVLLSFGFSDWQNAPPPQCDVVVTGLDVRDAEREQAVRAVIGSLHRMDDVRQVFYHYSSTFDSRNIGPVIEALMRELGVGFTVAVPAHPSLGHTQYMGNLFLDGIPVNETLLGTRPHDPITDANLVRRLEAQTSRRIGLLRWRSRDNPDGEITLVDALEEADLARAAHQFAEARLLTGSYGFAAHLPKHWGLPSRGAETTPPLLIPASGDPEVLRNQLEYLRSADCPYRVVLSPGNSAPASLLPQQSI